MMDAVFHQDLYENWLSHVECCNWWEVLKMWRFMEKL